MALNINTTIELKGGLSVASAYGVVFYQPQQLAGDNYVIDVRIRIYKDKAAFDAGEAELSLDSGFIPNQVLNLQRFSITNAQYSNLDAGVIHTNLINLLEDGDADGNWNPNWGSWAGLGATTVTAVDLL